MLVHLLTNFSQPPSPTYDFLLQLQFGFGITEAWLREDPRIRQI